MKKNTFIFYVLMFFFAGLCLILASEYFSTLPKILKNAITATGIGLIATSLISFLLDLTWSKYRIQQEKKEMEPFLERLNKFSSSMDQLEDRLKTLKAFGFKNCYSNRDEALKKFYRYAEDKLRNSQNSDECLKCLGTIDIVSSSARGLMGYLDREPSEIQKKWFDLITDYPQHFRFLLTHPSYAHLRQPAEERGPGDIELEILKTMVYLYCVCSMKEMSLRLYRGSPTVFQVQIDKHILLNPYAYGKMAMETLVLEFESEEEDDYRSFVEGFANKHFNHTWTFIQQQSVKVANKPLVVGINSFNDILLAFSDCTLLTNKKRLRLKKAQVEELDYFITKSIPEKLKQKNNDSGLLPDDNKPFENYLLKNRSDLKPYDNYIFSSEDIIDNKINSAHEKSL